MTQETFVIETVEGAKELVDWYGTWPSFHDAEIVQVFLSNENESEVKIDLCRYSSKLDEEGCFVADKRAFVRLLLAEITELSLQDFSEQNVISELVVEKSDQGVLLVLKPCYGLSGKIGARSLRVEFEPLSASE